MAARERSLPGAPRVAPRNSHPPPPFRHGAGNIRPQADRSSSSSRYPSSAPRSHTSAVASSATPGATADPGSGARSGREPPGAAGLRPRLPPPAPHPSSVRLPALSLATAGRGQASVVPLRRRRGWWGRAGGVPAWGGGGGGRGEALRGRSLRRPGTGSPPGRRLGRPPVLRPGHRLGTGLHRAGRDTTGRRPQRGGEDDGRQNTAHGRHDAFNDPSPRADTTPSHGITRPEHRRWRPACRWLRDDGPTPFRPGPGR